MHDVNIRVHHGLLLSSQSISSISFIHISMYEYICIEYVQVHIALNTSYFVCFDAVFHPDPNSLHCTMWKMSCMKQQGITNYIILYKMLCNNFFRFVNGIVNVVCRFGNNNNQIVLYFAV